MASLGRFGCLKASKELIVDLCHELSQLPPEQRRDAFQGLSLTTRQAIKSLDYEWVLYARPEQLPPEGSWRWWMLAGGRGGGKTRTGCETFLDLLYENPGARACVVGRDAGSVRRIQVDGASGLLHRSPPWFKPRWYKSEKLLVFPNDTIVETHSSEEPQTLRGPEYNFAWLTELFHWHVPKANARQLREAGRVALEPPSWSEGIRLGLRLSKTSAGKHVEPRGLIDSSPRATEFCINLLLGKKGPKGDRPVTQEQIDSGEWRIEHAVTDHEGKEHTYTVVIRRWASERNASNLAPGVVAEWRHDLRGSRLEKQELDGLILTKVEGALWTLDSIERDRETGVPVTLIKVIVAVDPTRSNSPVDEAGIIAAGLGENGIVYILEDASVRGSPGTWFGRALQVCYRFSADALVYELNRMGETVRKLARAEKARVQLVEVSATQNKETRAEPVSALYEAREVSHVGTFPELEDEMISWVPGMPSPNRMDALVWAVTALKLGETHTKLRLI